MDNKIVEIAIRLPAEQAEKWSVALSNDSVKEWCKERCVKAAVFGLQRNVVLADTCPKGYCTCGETKDGNLVCFPADWV